MRLLLLTASAVALSGCSWMSHMSDAEYHNYGHSYNSGGTYAGDGNCGYVAPKPVPAACANQVIAKPAYTVQQQAHSYPAPQPSAHWVQSQQTYQMPQQPSYVIQQPQVVHNYEQAYTQAQPTYTTGHYGSHAGTVYQQPLRGYYGAPKDNEQNRFYVQAYGGLNLQHESSLEGVTTGFTSGNIGDGTTMSVVDGTAYGWETEFDKGQAFGVEAGMRLQDGWRIGLEGTRTSADVDRHSEFILDGADIGDLDGATLVGAATPLGATVNEFMADGQGDIQQTGVFLNGYYDFNQGGRFSPYVGAGIGMVDVDVNYAPSGSLIIDEGGTAFGYQGRVGASYNVNGPLDVFTEYTYRATGDVSTENQLFAGEQDLKTKQSLVTVGARYNF